MQTIDEPLSPTQKLMKYDFWLYTILITIANLLLLGRYTSYLGIYYDEYATFYVLERFGFDRLIDLAGGQSRQLAGFLISLTSSNILFGHIVMFLISTSCAILLMWLLRRVFPNVPFIGALAGLFYLTYPVYFMRVYLTALAIEGSLLVILLSFVLTYYAIRRTGLTRWIFASISLLLIPIYINLYEMPIALETLRPFIIWAALRDNVYPQKINMREMLSWNGLLVMGVLLSVFYRLFIFEPYGFYADISYNTDVSTPQTSSEILQFFLLSVAGARATLINVWQNALEVTLISLSPYTVIAGTVIAIIGFYIVNVASLPRGNSFKIKYSKGLRLTVLGGAGLSTVSHAVIQLVGRSISPNAYFYNYTSRVYIISYIGALLFILGVLWILINIPPQRIGRIIVGSIVAIMLFIGSVTHIRWHDHHVKSWDATRQFMWQLAEIAPNIEDGTTVIMSHNHTIVFIDYLPMMMGDLFYDNQSLVFVLATSTNPDNMPAFNLDNGDWGFSWISQLEQAILFHEDENGCVHLIDPDAPINDSYDFSENMEALLSLLPSNPSQFISSNPIDNTFVRERYLPHPATLNCQTSD